MGWFNNLFRPKPADSGRESEVQPSVDPFTIRNQDDETYRSNRDVIKALRFSVTLQIRTPLSTLAHHGELYEAGFTNLESITSATEENLLQIPGLGRGTVQKILGAETQKH